MFLSFYLNHDFLAVLDPERHFFPVLQLQSISDSLGYAQYQIAPDLANLDAERLFPDLVQQQNSHTSIFLLRFSALAHLPKEKYSVNKNNQMSLLENLSG
jgi:hypothetical protein